MRLNIAFLHPELGLGGAERWVVDTALSLHQAGHRVVIHCADYDPTRAFADIAAHGLEVKVRGRLLPAQIFGRLRAPCALLRMAWVSFALRLSSDSYDLIVADLVSHTLPVLGSSNLGKVVFYCHYPDLRLTPPRRGIYAWYRRPLDWLERHGLEAADHILVNSRFTRQVLQQTFPGLAAKPAELLYPAIDVESFSSISPLPENPALSDRIILLAMGRLDRTKNLELAIDTLPTLRDLVPTALFERIKLVIAGGFDSRLPEQSRLLEQLHSKVLANGVEGQVEFRLNPPDREKHALYGDSTALLFTPLQEHFGLVPLEAMAAARPVLAVNGGGPRETVLHETTGYLLEAEPAAFAYALASLLTEPGLAKRMGLAGRARAVQHFSRNDLGPRLLALRENRPQGKRSSAS